jgi:hypothetical protein
MTTKSLNLKISSRTSRTQISPLTLSVALLVCSVVWLAGACACYAPSASHVDWSTTSLLWPMILMITPSICFSIATILLNTRPPAHLSRLERSALVAAFFPVILGAVWTIWIVKVLFWAGFQDAPIALKSFVVLTGPALVAISGSMIWKTTRILIPLRGI